MINMTFFCRCRAWKSVSKQKAAKFDRPDIFLLPMKFFLYRKAVLIAVFLLVALLSPEIFADGPSSDVPIEQGKFSQPRFRLSATLNEGYDDNTETTKTNKIASGFTNFETNAFADLGSSRTLFTIGITAGVNAYYDRPGQKIDKLASLTLNLSHKINERFTLTLSTYFTYQVEPDFTLQVEQNRINGQYFYTGDTLSGSYQWTRRFQTVTSYNLVGIVYQDSAANANDYFAHNFANDLRFLVLPTTTLVATYRLTLVDYLYGTSRNTITNSLMVGLDHSFSPKFTVTLRGGGQLQSQESGGTTTSPYGELTVNYSYRKGSSVHGYLHYGFDYSNVVAGQSDQSLRMGVVFNHAFTAKLSASLGCFYEHDNFSQIASTGTGEYTEDTLNLNAGLSFAVTSKFSLQAGFIFTKLLSDNSALEYNRDVVSIGGTYSF